ncbi:DMT family transporter [Pannonibacter indicus]|uniref:DMT family transporter n=1 Tax=Pannonibacter indicus TaxID=466044 RepID=UPI003919F064
MSTQAQKLAPIAFISLWSTGFIGSKLGAPYIEPFAFLALRYAFAVPLLISLGALLGSGRYLPVKTAIHCMVTGTLVHGIYLGGVFWAIRQGLPAGAAALMVGLQPVVTALAAGWLLKEQITWRHWLGFAGGSAGLLLVLLPKLGEAASGITSVTVSVMLVSVIAISLGTVYQKRFVQGADHVTGTTWQYAGALLFTVPLTFTETWEITWSPQLIFAMAWLVLVLSIGAILLLMYMIRTGSAAEVGSLFYLVPAATTLESYFLFGETLTLVQIAGMVLIMAAILFIRRKPRPA